MYGGEAYYRLEGVFEGPMLPKMHEAVELGGEVYTARLWDAFSDGEYCGVPQLLDTIGAVLEDGARRETRKQPLTGATLHNLLPGRLAFQRPLETGGSCMLVDERKVAAAQDMWTHNQRYTMLHLGGIAGRGHLRIYETAHRVVTWSMHGPPPMAIVRPVVMHVCNQCNCLHPGHMVWGEDAENFGDRPRFYAMQRRMQQRGY